MKNKQRIPIVLALLALFLTGCSQKHKSVKRTDIPDPAFARSAVARIDSLLGYAFSWKFSRKQAGMMPRMRADLDGKVSVPSRIHIKGSWSTGAAVEKLNSYSIDGREYTFDDASGTWEHGSSGSFLDPHEHLKLVLSFGEFSFVEFDPYRREDCSVFSFKPNVYFLDPVETSEPEGRVWISNSRGIPLRVRVTAKQGMLSWDMELSEINSFADLNVPFQKSTFRVSDIDREEDVETIIKRFLYLGFERPQADRENGSVVFRVKAEHLSDTLIESLLKRGSIELLLGAWPAHPVYVLSEDTSLLNEHYGKGARLLFERGIVTKPIIAVGSLLKHDAFDAFELRNDLLGAYSIYAVVAADAHDTLSALVSKRKDEPVVALVDGMAMHISHIRDAWIVEQKIPLAQGLEGSEAVRIYARLKEKPLEKDYTFMRIEKEE
jgi:hypothetical protein